MGSRVPAARAAPRCRTTRWARGGASGARPAGGGSGARGGGTRASWTGRRGGGPDPGSPHGSVRAPRCAQGAVHAVLDTWGETVVPAHGRGHGVLSRSADAGVMGGERAAEARRSREVVPTRCAKYGLESHTAQTTVVRWGRPPRPSAAPPPGPGRWLGCVHSWGHPWRGSSTSKRQTEGKRLRRPLGACGRGWRDNRHRAPQEQDVFLGVKRRGAVRAAPPWRPAEDMASVWAEDGSVPAAAAQDRARVGVRGHSRSLNRFFHWALDGTFQWLTRRGGKQSSYTWEQCTHVLNRVKIACPRITEVLRRSVFA
jgi:hypothetical protein